MASFECKVVTPQGQTVIVNMREKDKISCFKRLKENGMTPIEVTKKFDPFGFIKEKTEKTAVIHSQKDADKTKINLNKEIKFSSKISLDELKKFTQEFYLLKQSKFSNKDAMLAIISGATDEKFKIVLEDILKNIESEVFMYKAMQEHPSVFPKVYINLIKTGEITGNLEESLQNAVKYLDGEILISTKLQNELDQIDLTQYDIDLEKLEKVKDELDGVCKVLIYRCDTCFTKHFYCKWKCNRVTKNNNYIICIG
mgnify:CR=1 FL=1